MKTTQSGLLYRSVVLQMLKYEARLAVSNVLDTHTKPEPHKSAAQLWFEARVHGQYGSIWERAEDSIALAMERAINSQLPDDEDVRDAMRMIRGGVSRRPRIDEFEMSPGFIRDELGKGSQDDYWKTQHTFLHKNVKRERDHEALMERLESARKVLSRKVTA